MRILQFVHHVIIILALVSSGFTGCLVSAESVPPGVEVARGTTKHYIRQGAEGAQDGSSWNNAWPSFAAVKYARGDTYYVAGGTYNEAVAINCAVSGSEWITIKKATTWDTDSCPPLV